MRSFWLLLLAATAVLAQDGDAPELDAYTTAMASFERAKKRTTSPGAKAAVYPALEQLVAAKDVRTIGPLCAYLNETRSYEAALSRESKTRQRKAADAVERMQALQKEISQLRLKERAGDTSVGPAIEKRIAEARSKQKVFDETVGEVARIDKQLNFIVALRDRIVESCAEILSGIDGSATERGLAQTRRSLDVVDRWQALYCVRILRDSKLPQAEPHLLQIIAHPKAEAPVVRAAILALAPVLSKTGAESLLALWERNPEHAAAIQHTLSTAARKRIADREAATKWVATLG